MFYVLGEQNLYFPSSDDQSYQLKLFLQNHSQQEYRLPIIVKIKSLNVSHGSIKNLLSKNSPLLLLDIDQLHSILAEYRQSNRSRLLTKKFLSKKKFSRSLVTFTDSYQFHEQSDDDYDNTRTIVRTVNEKCSSSTLLCRVPVEYSGYFELLNENDQAMEPYRRLVDFLTDQPSCSTFFLRTSCLAYTKRYIPNERKLSASADSSYGSLSDLESQKNLHILNDDPQILSPGQIITIVSQCSAHRSQRIDRHSQEEQLISHSSTSAWLREQSRRIFPKKKSRFSVPNGDFDPIGVTPKLLRAISTKPEAFLKCRTEQGDLVYISLETPGLFSPISDPTIDIAGIFQLKQLIPHFRFPISVRLLDNSVSFDQNFQPASIQKQQQQTSTAKFRLLLPYVEHVVFACPLITPSSMKTQPIVIPIPINTDMQVQRCLNMREIVQNRSFQKLIHMCTPLIRQYQSQFSPIHFPLILNSTTISNTKRKTPIFKKRSRSESTLFDPTAPTTNDRWRKSCELLGNSHSSDLESSSIIHGTKDQIFHRDSFQTIKEKLAHPTLDPYATHPARRSAYYAKLKVDKLKRSSQHPPELNSDDENYREVDHIYDYIRSGDLTDDVKRIQAKEQALNNIQRQNVTGNYQRFPHYLDDSRPLDSEVEDAIDDTPRQEERKPMLIDQTNVKIKAMTKH